MKFADFLKQRVNSFFGLTRKEMPQVYSDTLVPHLKAHKIPHHFEVIRAEDLKGSQTDVDTAKAAQIDLSDPRAVEPLIVSKDNFVIDGHHRWWAAFNLQDSGYHLPCLVIELPFKEAIRVISRFSRWD